MKETRYDLRIVKGEDVVDSSDGYKHKKGIKKHIKEFLKTQPSNATYGAVVTKTITERSEMKVGRGKVSPPKDAVIQTGSRVCVIKKIQTPHGSMRVSSASVYTVQALTLSKKKAFVDFGFKEFNKMNPIPLEYLQLVY